MKSSEIEYNLTDHLICKKCGWFGDAHHHYENYDVEVKIEKINGKIISTTTYKICPICKKYLTFIETTTDFLGKLKEKVLTKEEMVEILI